MNAEGRKQRGPHPTPAEKFPKSFSPKLEPQARGYELEKSVGELFEAYDLAPRSAFKLVGGMKGDRHEGPRGKPFYRPPRLHSKAG
jgi:hypothetical protein